MRHRRSIRLPNHDYTSGGWYYVTICTHNRRLFFENNNIKRIVRKYWLGISDHFNNVKLDECIIMPNHIHGIVVIIRRGGVTPPAVNGKTVPTTGAETAPLRGRGKPTLGQIIAYFKYQTTKQINNYLKNPPGQPLWQRNYYESIIRDESSLNRIRRYIKNNPMNWENDRNNPRNWVNNE